MNGIYELWVPGYPTAKGRPRMNRRGRVFTPKTTTQAENLIAALAYDIPKFDDDEGVTVAIDYSPEGQLITLWPAGRPGAMRGDLDNYVKLTLDGLQKTGAFDDRRIVDIRAAKYPKGHVSPTGVRGV